jgi:DNA helicase-2/ATP-dependent DNA helicase PcrA
MPHNPSQQKAIEEDGVQLIVARPDSGKTRVVTEKILHLINKGVKPPKAFLRLRSPTKQRSEC